MSWIITFSPSCSCRHRLARMERAKTTIVLLSCDKYIISTLYNDLHVSCQFQKQSCRIFLLKLVFYFLLMNFRTILQFQINRIALDTKIRLQNTWVTDHILYMSLYWYIVSTKICKQSQTGLGQLRFLALSEVKEYSPNFISLFGIADILCGDSQIWG